METTPKEPVLTGKEGGEIDHETAANWTKNHREKHPGEIVSHFFGKEILHKLLAQEGCMGLRFYHAHDHTDKRHLVIVGANSEGKDMLHTEGGHSKLMLGDQAAPCPGNPGCPKSILTGE